VAKWVKYRGYKEACKVLTEWRRHIHEINQYRKYPGSKLSAKGGVTKQRDRMAELLPYTRALLMALPSKDGRQQQRGPSEETLSKLKILAMYTLCGLQQSDCEALNGWGVNKANTLVAKYPEYIREFELEHFATGCRKMRQDLFNLQLRLTLLSGKALEVLECALLGKEYEGKPVGANQRAVAQKIIDAAQAFIKATGGQDFVFDEFEDEEEKLFEEVADAAAIDEQNERIGQLGAEN